MQEVQGGEGELAGGSFGAEGGRRGELHGGYGGAALMAALDAGEARPGAWSREESRGGGRRLACEANGREESRARAQAS